MKKRVYLLITATLLLFAMMFFSFKSTKTNTKKNYYTGVELFNGIFFKEGKVIKALPELAYSQKAMPADKKMNFVRKELLGKLAKSDPGFFEKFKNDVQSGNPVKIESRLLSAQDAVIKQLKAINDEQRVKDGVPNLTGIGANTSPVAFATVAAPYTLALVIDFGVIKVSSASAVAPENIKSRSLQTEAFVFSIAENLQN